MPRGWKKNKKDLWAAYCICLHCVISKHGHTEGAGPGANWPIWFLISIGPRSWGWWRPEGLVWRHENAVDHPLIISKLRLPCYAFILEFSIIRIVWEIATHLLVSFVSVHQTDVTPWLPQAHLEPHKRVDGFLRFFRSSAPLSPTSAFSRTRVWVVQWNINIEWLNLLYRLELKS